LIDAKKICAGQDYEHHPIGTELVMLWEWSEFQILISRKTSLFNLLLYSSWSSR